jgi:hypothetical protein
MAAAGESSRQQGQRGEFIAPEEGIRILAALLGADISRAAVLPMVWSEWRQRYPAFARKPFLSGVLDQAPGPLRSGTHVSRRAVLPSDPAERREALIALVTEVAATVVRLPAASLERAAPLRNIGMDSLMALEIRNQLQDRVGVTVSLVTIVEGPSLVELADVLLEALALAQSQGGVPPGGPGAAPENESVETLAGLDDLSDENVDALLRRMLAGR